MYGARISSSFRPLNSTRLASDPSACFPKTPKKFQLETLSLVPISSFSASRVREVLKSRVAALNSLSQDGPVSVELETINEAQFDRAIAEAQQLEESVIIVWIASWCRKCIYLKPKLEKLAADYYPRLRFYSVDVNKVPHKLVARAGVTKMPTIQLWKDGKKQAEVIGGHKAHLVINEVQEMIENESNA